MNLAVYTPVPPAPTGRQDLTPIAADPENELRRTTVSARIVEGSDGLRHTELITAQAVDEVAFPSLRNISLGKCLAS